MQKLSWKLSNRRLSPRIFHDVKDRLPKDAGELQAPVLRIINEPTAASLAYGSTGDVEQTILVYDLRWNL